MADRHEKQFLEGWEAMLTGRHANGDVVFRRILEDEPKHFFASFGRLAFLARADVDETIQERLEIARTVLASAPTTPGESLQALAIRFAADTLARESLRGSPTKERLLEGLRWAEQGAKFDAHFDHAPAGTISAAIAATRAKLLVALERDEEAYRIVQEVLDAKPQYGHFAGIQGTSGFQAWQAKRRSGKTAAFVKRVGNDLATDLNLAMWTAVDRLNQNKKHVALDRKLIDTFRMQATRGSKKNTVPLPPSLKALLAYDFGLKMGGRRFFEDLLGRARPKKGAVLLSTTMTEVFRSSSIAKGYRDLKKKTEADMPGLVEVPLGGDQRVFVYVAKTNADGEYPIVRFDEEPCIWASSGCLQDEIGSVTNEPIAGAEARKEAAKEAVAQWMVREPEQRFVETDDDDDDDH